jgi:riboflavin kinase / FMN adenylyltransferase
MKIIDLSNYKENNIDIAVALGNFDGIHIGHQNLIKTMVYNAKKMKLKPSLLLFREHTKTILSKSLPTYITSIEQKIEIAESLGVEIIYIINFDKKLMELSPDEFIEEILLHKMRSKLIVVGYDYRFGYKAKGDVSYLEKLSNKLEFKLKVINPIKNDGVVVSSSNIRTLIKEGYFEEVETMLQRPYSILGKVIKGENRGSKLGFPTANIELIDNYVIPKTGVYKTYTKVDGKIYKSATNIGYNPTFNKENKTLKFETYILDFKENIYGKTIEIWFKKWLRDDMKFKNVEDLIEQMKSDIKEVAKED